ncbi:MAG: 3-hydroxyacyl-ACP dehydratase FabZ [Halobacteriovoraceae bacterium]|nr:3-hydroxyacyl-ACP dehydratase FabZ [Halobacteriovoraceae bacterium]
MDNNDILSIIPQRDPFLFVDKIIERDNSHIHAQKKITGHEDFFRGHFPGNPIMPGVLLLESIFQTGALLIAGQKDGKVGVVTRIDNVKFKGIVRPGDLLNMKVKLDECLQNAYYFNGHIEVNQKKILTLKFVCALIDEKNS